MVEYSGITKKIGFSWILLLLSLKFFFVVKKAAIIIHRPNLLTADPAFFLVANNPPSCYLFFLTRSLLLCKSLFPHVLDLKAECQVDKEHILDTFSLASVWGLKDHQKLVNTFVPFIKKTYTWKKIWSGSLTLRKSMNLNTPSHLLPHLSSQ